MGWMGWMGLVIPEQSAYKSHRRAVLKIVKCVLNMYHEIQAENKTYRKSQLPALAQTNIITCKIDIFDNMSDLSGFHHINDPCRVE